MGAVRKALSILLLMLFTLPSFAALPGMGQGVEAGLPACCRRGGAHHCMMDGAERGGVALAGRREARWTAAEERCPYRPAAMVQSLRRGAFSLGQSQAPLVATFSHPTGAVQTECRRRIAHDRSRQERGPPLVIG